MGLLCAGKLSTLVGEGQFHGGGDAVGAAEHGLSCLVEVAACNTRTRRKVQHIGSCYAGLLAVKACGIASQEGERVFYVASS